MLPFSSVMVAPVVRIAPLRIAGSPRLTRRVWVGSCRAERPGASKAALPLAVPAPQGAPPASRPESAA